MELKEAAKQAATEERSRPPASVKVLALVLAVAGAAIVTVRLADSPHWNGRDLLALAGLVGAIAVAERFSIRLWFRTERLNFTLTEAVWVGALMLARPSVLAIAVAAGILIGQLARKVAPLKLAFNFGQFMVALTAAQLIYRGFHPHALPGLRVWAATAAAMASYAVINASLVALVISLVAKTSFMGVLMPPLPANAFHFGGNTALGVVGAAVWVASPLGMPAMALLTALAYISYQSLVRAVPIHLPALS